MKTASPALAALAAIAVLYPVGGLVVGVDVALFSILVALLLNQRSAWIATGVLSRRGPACAALCVFFLITGNAQIQPIVLPK